MENTENIVEEQNKDLTLVDSSVLPSVKTSEQETSKEPKDEPLTDENTEPDEDDESPQLKYLTEFKNLFENFDLTTIRQKVLDRQLKRSDFTTILWRLFLEIFPREISEWKKFLDKFRQEYQILLEKFLASTKDPRLSIGDKSLCGEKDHPLSPDAHKRFEEFQEIENLKESIQQDVKRTFPDLEYFQEPSRRTILTRILLIRTRIHPKPIPYRQGMHELLAVIFHLLDQEIQLALIRLNDSESFLRKIYEPNFLEHDAFTIYSVVLEKTVQFYDLQMNQSNKNEKRSVGLYKSSSDILYQSNTTVRRINDIFESFKLIDQKIYLTLKDLQLEPIIYGVRWVRLLFAREIQFCWIPKLWTVIFCFDKQLTFVDFVFHTILIEASRKIEKGEIEKKSHLFLQILMQTDIIRDIEKTIIDAVSIANKYASIQSKSNLTEIHSVQPTNQKAERYQNLKESRQPFKFSSQFENRRTTFGSNRIRSGNQVSDAETEMIIDPGKQSNQIYQENLNFQNNAARFIYETINNMRTEIDVIHDKQETIETIKLKLSGLEQIAHVLSGNASLDENCLQSLIDYG